MILFEKIFRQETLVKNYVDFNIDELNINLLRRIVDV